MFLPDEIASTIIATLTSSLENAEGEIALLRTRLEERSQAAAAFDSAEYRIHELEKENARLRAESSGYREKMAVLERQAFAAATMAEVYMSPPPAGMSHDLSCAVASVVRREGKGDKIRLIRLVRAVVGSSSCRDVPNGLKEVKVAVEGYLARL